MIFDICNMSTLSFFKKQVSLAIKKHAQIYDIYSALLSLFDE